MLNASSSVNMAGSSPARHNSNVRLSLIFVLYFYNAYDLLKAKMRFVGRSKELDAISAIIAGIRERTYGLAELDKELVRFCLPFCF